jgi:hypothetical protein
LSFEEGGNMKKGEDKNAENEKRKKEKIEKRENMK